jgi:hypothetical protein
MLEVRTLKSAYQEIKKALPFLDCYVSDWQPVYENAAAEIPTEAVKLSFDSGNPRLVRQTEHSFEEIAEMAKNSPDINFIIVSGEKKLMYHITALVDILTKYRNVFLATANLCNGFALERLAALGLAEKLLLSSDKTKT